MRAIAPQRTSHAEANACMLTSKSNSIDHVVLRTICFLKYTLQSLMHKRGTTDDIRPSFSWELLGKPVFHAELKIVGKDGSEICPGETGEIVVRGPILMSGYWKRDEQTRIAVKDGWFHTGDLATIDDDGYIYIIDRAHDTYISGGENIHPAEIERVLLSNPKILDAAVYGIPDEKWG
jgi:acyl-CoA synthetase (AMP-forming)/AMP-acid ligase II